MLEKMQKRISYNVIETDDELSFLLRISKFLLIKKQAFTYMDANRQILVREPENGGKILIPVDVEKTVLNLKRMLK